MPVSNRSEMLIDFLQELIHELADELRKTNENVEVVVQIATH